MPVDDAVLDKNDETKMAEEMLKEGIAPEDIELAMSAFRELRTKEITHTDNTVKIPGPEHKN